MGVILQNMTREQMGALALPERVYQCGLCGQTYPHDHGYAHDTRECPQAKPGTK